MTKEIIRKRIKGLFYLFLSLCNIIAPLIIMSDNNADLFLKVIAVVWLLLFAEYFCEVLFKKYELK